MLIYILGIITGMLLSFGARLADKDITRIVERYSASGSVLQSKPIIVDGKNKGDDVAERYFQPEIIEDDEV